jgi:hypothetical protein
VVQAQIFTVLQATTDPKNNLEKPKLRDEDLRWLSVLTRLSFDSLDLARASERNAELECC